MNILQLTCHYYPNIGGVETHLKDLVNGLLKFNQNVYVLTYTPITTKAKWKLFEKRNNFEIIRIPWLRGLFYKLVPYPLLEFAYLFPGLFIFTPYVILKNDISVIHAHGLIAGAVGYIWGSILKKRVIISTHSIYHFPPTGVYKYLSYEILNGSDFILTLSKGSKNEVEKLGINKNKIQTFTYWVDLNVFNKVKDAKKKLNWNTKFVVLFVGRLVPEKGIYELLKACDKWNKNISLAIAGSGPLENEIAKKSKKNKNILFLGKIDNNDLPLYYSASDLLIVPSIHEEGFGRVIIESLACGTPVIGSNRGAIPEAIDKNVGKLIDITPENIKYYVEYYYKNPIILSKLSGNARRYAEKKYSENNILSILKTLSG